MSKTKPPENAREVALLVLKRVFTGGAYASAVLRSELDRGTFSTPDRGLATELAYGVLRHRVHLDRAIRQAGNRRIKDIDPMLHDVLRLGAYQLIFLERVPAHAAVDTSVELAKSRRGKRGAGMVNAILRKLVAIDPADRVPPVPPAKHNPIQHLGAKYSVPQSIAKVLHSDLGFERAAAFLEASTQSAGTTLRANLLRTTREALVDEVGGRAGISPCAVALPDKLGTLPAKLPCVIEGRATPQDEASMAVVELLDPQPGDRVFDMCAAPGGKTTYIAERMKNEGQVLAYDRNLRRLSLVAKSAERLGLSCIESTEVPPLVEEPLFDRVLVDAPCSGLGTLRRHPELRWRFVAEDVDRLAKVQSKILADARHLVRVGGTLVYSVCTVTHAEGAAHLEALSEEFEVQEKFLTGPDQPGAPDGFFAARLVRR